MSTVSAKCPKVFAEILSKFDNFFFDCDGVIWHGKDGIKDAANVINRLQKLGKTVLYVSNNSTESRDCYVDKLTQLGFTARKDQVFGSGYTSALYLKKIAKVSGKVYVVGNSAMAEELSNLGVENFGSGPDSTIVTSQDKSEVLKCSIESNVQAVLVGYDGHISYTKLIKAATYLNDPDCLFVATNGDSRMPSKGSPIIIPGTGCIVGAVAIASERTPIICGKPGRFMLDCIQETMSFDPSRTLMIGDRLNTDILFGNSNGLKTLLVMTGVTDDKTLENLHGNGDLDLKKQIPDYVLPSIGDWSEYFEE